MRGAQSRGIEPIIAVEKQSHAIDIERILKASSAEQPTLPVEATAKEQMAHPTGKAAL